MRSRRRVVACAAVAIVSVTVAGFGVFLAAQGLEDADRWASVVGVFVGLLGLGLAVWTPAAAPPVDDKAQPGTAGSTYHVASARNTFEIHGDVRVRQTWDMRTGPSTTLLLALGAGQIAVLAVLAVMALG